MTVSSSKQGRQPFRQRIKIALKKLQRAERGVRNDTAKKGNRITGFELPVLMVRRALLRRQRSQKIAVLRYHIRGKQKKRQLERAKKECAKWENAHDGLLKKLERIRKEVSAEELNSGHIQNWFSREKSIRGEMEAAHRRLRQLREGNNAIQ